MASFSVTPHAYKIRFYNSRRTPKEKSLSLSRSDWTRGEAKRHMRELVVRYEKGTFDPWLEAAPGRASQEAPRLGPATEAYIQAKTRAGRRGERGGWSAMTRRGKEPLLKDFARWAGWNKHLADLARADLSDYIHQPHLEHETKRSYRKILRALVNWFYQEDLLDRPKRKKDSHIPPPLEKIDTFPAYVTRDELEDICKAHRRLAIESAHANGPDRLWMIDLYWFRFWQGHRPGEAIAQRVGGIDLDRGLIQVGDSTFVPKNKSAATIPLLPPARPLTRRLCEGRKRTERLFGHTSYDKASDAFREAALKVVPHKVHEENLSFYNLRHSCGVYWRRQGVPLEDIQKLLRHKDISQTQIYAEIEPGELGRHFEQAWNQQG